MNWRAISVAGSRTLYPVHRSHGVILLLLLIFTLLLGMGNSLHSRMLWVGEQTWPNYYLLNPDATEPTCNKTMDVEAEVRKRMNAYEPDPDDLFSSPPDAGAIRESLERNLALCEQKHQMFAENQKHATAALSVFKTVEQGFASFLLENIELTKFLFIAMFAMAAAISALDADHIALRLPRNRAEWRLSQGAQLAVNGLMVFSLYSYIGRLANSPGTEDTIVFQYAWAAVFGLFMIINLVRFVNVPERMKPGSLSASSGLVVPLYCVMGLIAMSYFFLTRPGFSGASRGIFELLETEPDITGKAVAVRRAGQRIIELIGKRAVHPVTLGIGRFLERPSRKALDELRSVARELKELSFDLLEEVAVCAPVGDVARQVAARCQGRADRVSLVAHWTRDPDLWDDVVRDLSAAD